MAAEVKARIKVECSGLGSGVLRLSDLFTDSNTPDDYRLVETVISTTANLLSAVVNVPSAEILGLMAISRDGNVYWNNISSYISIAGTYVADGQCQMLTFSPGNSCKISFKGDDADTAITCLVWAAAT